MRKRTTTDKTLRKVSTFVRKMKISDGDVLLVKKGSWLATEAGMEALRQKIDEINLSRGVIMIAVESLDDIEKADPKVMHKYGWFKFPIRKE